MIRPGWVTVVGVLMIIFGALGLIGNLQGMFAPKFMDFQQRLIERAMEQAEREDPEAADILEGVEEMMETPDWFPTFIAIYGFFGVIIMAVYLFAGINLLQLKPTALKWTYWALGLSLAFAFIQIIIALMFTSLIAIGLMMGGTISIVIGIIILIVILVNNKGNYPTNRQPINATV